MITRISSLAILTLGLGVAAFPGSASADHEIALANRAAALRSQASRVHFSLEHQFIDSPYVMRLCRLSKQVEELACQLEEELLVGCANNRAKHLIDVADHRFHALESTYQTALHRANVGIDPPVGCTMALDRQLRQMRDSIHCLQDEVRAYQPLSRQVQRPISAPSHIGVSRSIGHGQSHHGGYDRYSGHRSNGPSVSFQRGSFRFTFGG